jgi:phage terminase large subunit-like protein
LPERLTDKGGWKNEALWGFVNPNLNRSVNLEFLRRELADAESEGIDKLALISSQHFNVEAGVALRSDRWVGADFWESASSRT